MNIMRELPLALLMSHLKRSFVMVPKLFRKTIIPVRVRAKLLALYLSTKQIIRRGFDY